MNLFRFRTPLLLLFLAITVVLGILGSGIKVDAGFEKQLPKSHPFIKTFLEYQTEFGGANRVLIAVSPKTGEIFDEGFLRTLQSITDEMYEIEGVNLAQINSLFTPNTRFVEIVDGGFAGGRVVPADFDFSETAINQVKENLIKSTYVGRLVAADFTSAMVAIELLPDDQVDYLQVAQTLEEQIREKYRSDNIEIRIIGFAKAIGDIAKGARGVLLFLAATLILVGVMLYLFLHSWKLTGLALFCSLVGVTWNIGLIRLFGYGFDPMSILVPFLVFAIGVSHAVQMLNRINIAIQEGANFQKAAKIAIAALLLPGLVALLSDTLGFATIHLIDVRIIQELAIMASLGVAVLVFTNLILLPLLVTYLGQDAKHKKRVERRRAMQAKWWDVLALMTNPRPALIAIGVMIVLLGSALTYAAKLPIGDQKPGVPQLRQDSVYNEDTAYIVDKYAIGVDLLNVIIETPKNGCIDHAIVSEIDRFEWVVANNPNVQSTLSLPQIMKLVSAGWAEGHPKWRSLSRNPYTLVQAVSSIDPSIGLMNVGCTAMPVLIFLKDHKAESINSVVATIQDYKISHPDVNIRLATGNAGVMAAVNETVAKAQFPILGWIYAAVTLLCLALFRSVRATIAVIIPLMVVSVIAYALMAITGIGLTTSSLPVAALGVGIGVDYGIYIFSQLARRLKAGEKLSIAYRHTLEVNGSAVLVTGLTLALAVSTWILSDLQFQADMGLLFASMLILNMLGALCVVPALAYFLFPNNR